MPPRSPIGEPGRPGEVVAGPDAGREDDEVGVEDQPPSENATRLHRAVGRDSDSRQSSVQCGR